MPPGVPPAVRTVKKPSPLSAMLVGMPVAATPPCRLLVSCEKAATPPALCCLAGCSTSMSAKSVSIRL